MKYCKNVRKLGGGGLIIRTAGDSKWEIASIDFPEWEFIDDFRADMNDFSEIEKSEADLIIEKWNSMKKK